MVPVAAADQPTAIHRSDAALVSETLGGDDAAFAMLVARYERSARAICYGVLRDWHLAQDGAQDGFVSAYRNLHRLRSPSSFGPWLLTIMRRQAERIRRRRRPAAPLHLQPEPISTAGNSTGPDTEALLAAVSALPEHERVVVTLRYFEQLDVNDIARICGRPVGTGTKQLSRAHGRLETALNRSHR